jgi:hypothetical protein
MTAAEFHQQQLEQQEREETMKMVLTPTYCDLIASTIKTALNKAPDDRIVGCGPVKFDLDEYGSFASTKKTMFVIDRVGRHYKVTVEEV